MKVIWFSKVIPFVSWNARVKARENKIPVHYKTFMPTAWPPFVMVRTFVVSVSPQHLNVHRINGKDIGRYASSTAELV